MRSVNSPLKEIPIPGRQQFIFEQNGFSALPAVLMFWLMINKPFKLEKEFGETS